MDSNKGSLRKLIATDVSYIRYFILLGSTKIYHYLKEVYKWSIMKKGSEDCLAKCLNWQKHKVQNQRPIGLAQNIEIQ